MSEETNEPTTSEGGEIKRPSKTVLVLAAIFLTAPACIPFYYGIQQDDPLLQGVFIGAGFSLVIFNAFALVLIYRWIARD